MKLIGLLEFLLLVGLAAGRGLMLRRRGINAFLFGSSDKSDFLLMPVVALLFYSILSEVFGLPMPYVMSRRLFDNSLVNWTGIVICAASLVWFALTLKSFGDSFRIGIDETTPDKLITGGMFALSRNPIYVAFISFISGMFMAYPTVTNIIVLAIFIAAIHRQILREERFLRSHYGNEYEEYCKKVGRYI